MSRTPWPHTHLPWEGVSQGEYIWDQEAGDEEEDEEVGQSLFAVYVWGAVEE